MLRSSPVAAWEFSPLGLESSYYLSVTLDPVTPACVLDSVRQGRRRSTTRQPWVR